jgi:transposase
MIVSRRAAQDCCCPKYLGLLSENARLLDENARLKEKLKRQERSAKEAPFGLSTPSSKRLVKPSLPELTPEEINRRKGGAAVGHAGHGWKTPEGAEPEIENLPPLNVCPCCGGSLIDFPGEEETVRDLIDCHPLPAFRRRVRVPARYCTHCCKPVRPRVPGVLPKTRLCNNVLARVASEHYLDGVPMGTVARRLGVLKGTLLHEMHRLAALFNPAVDGLLDLLRDAAVKHADETPWRTDGNNGYAWVFVAGRVTIFVCEQTRAMSVPEAVLADCVGKLVTDRYAAYNCFAGDRSYCFEHLKRDTLSIVEENPHNTECAAFSAALVPWLCAAMSLRTICAGDHVTFLVRAVFIRKRIEEIVQASAHHPSVQHIQDIFRENEARLWHWTENPRVPAENNTAERAARPLAIARKVSHGSQSVKGRQTRSVLMSVLHTLKACCTDPAARLAQALDHEAQDSGSNMFSRLFGGLPLYIPTQ